MSTHNESNERFIAYLQELNNKDRGAMAILRRSLAFPPGAYPPAFPFIERFISRDTHELDSRRLACYAVAGLFARNARQRSESLAAALGRLMRERGSASIEHRFIALLGADSENVHDYLRQILSLLSASEMGLDYARLLNDLTIWMNPVIDPARRDSLRQRWARDFYREVQSDSPEDTTTTITNAS
jgi:CRISPR system Cascade subunit CasB